MNKNDFYKELMKTYTFDSAKVRRFAKRSSYRGNRVSVKRWWHIPSTVAVAAASLTVGILAFFYSPNMNPPPDGEPCDLSSVSAQGIIHLSNHESRTLYLSFNNSMTYLEMLNTLESVSDTGNIIVEKVYVLDSEENIVPVIQHEELRNDHETQIIGAKVFAPERLKVEIERQPEIANVKIETPAINDDTWIPSPVTDTPFVAPIDPDELPADDPDGDSIAAVVIESLVNLNVAGIIEADFIGDFSFTAITADSVILFEISQDEATEDLEINPASEFVLHNHRTRLSTTGNSMLISGCREDSRRNVLLLADAETQTLEEIDIRDLIETGELIFAFYDDINKRIVMRVRVSERNIIYVMELDSGEVFTAFDSHKSAAILAINDDSLYHSVFKESEHVTAVYRFDIASGTSTIVESLSLTDSVSFERNSNLSAFVANIVDSDGVSNAMVFTAVTETLTEALEVPRGLNFHRNLPDLLTDGENNYVLSHDRDALEVFTERIPRTRRNISERFAVFEITENGVRIMLKD
jgi:hypothetical protein